MVKKANIVTAEKLRGGTGSAEIHHFLTKEELLGHGKMFAKVILKPHSSIGWHQHVGDTEPYIILKGEAIFTDNDGTKTTVLPGDICTIEVGHWHSLENATEEDVELIALVLNE